MTSRTTRKDAARARAAELRAQQARAERRRRLLLAGGAVAVVIVVVAALVIAKVAGVGGGTGKTTASTTASAQVVRDVTSVPAATLDKVGVGSAQLAPSRIAAPALTAGGKPRVVYIGAEYCPYCAAERWAVVVALSRFGTWSGLGATESSASDVYPGTQTLSFHGAAYTSKYLSFTGVETHSNTPQNGTYAPLDSPSPADQKLFDTYDRPPYTPGTPGGIPFIDIGGRYISSGASYSPQVLAGKSRADIAAALADPNSPVAKAVDGSANVLTAAICTTTNNQPATVCSAPGVTAAAAALAKAK